MALTLTPVTWAPADSAGQPLANVSVTFTPAADSVGSGTFVSAEPVVLRPGANGIITAELVPAAYTLTVTEGQQATRYTVTVPASLTPVDLDSLLPGWVPAPEASVTRGAFFYPWYPESWYPTSHWTPVLGAPYASADPAVVAYQVNAMEYCGIQVAISSWWGQADPTNTVFPQLLAASAGMALQWCLYYEPGPGTSGGGTAGTPWGTVSALASITADLIYIYETYVSSPAYAQAGGKPLLFVYGRSVTDQNDITTWHEANLGAGTALGLTGGAFTLDLQVIGGFQAVANPPALWHQYAPANQVQATPGYYYTISPGYWKYDDPVQGTYISGGINDPYLPRTPAAWAAAVKSMVASGAPWQLITSWNEWGEGHSVEAAVQWPSASGYGVYADILASNGLIIPPAPPLADVQDETWGNVLDEAAGVMS